MIAQTVTIIRKNFSYLLAAEAIVRLMMLALTIYIARAYGTEKFGVYTLALSIGSLFEIVFNLGICAVFMQRVAKNIEDIQHQLSIFLPLKIVLATASFVCFAVFALTLGKSPETFICLILAGLYFSFYSVETFLYCCFDARQKMHFGAGIKILKFAVIAGLGAYFTLIISPVYYLMHAYIAGTVASILASVYFISRYFAKIKFKFDFRSWKQIISEGWPITFSSAFVFIYNSVDTIIISIIKGENAVGLYQVSYKIIGTCFILSTLINQAYFPALVKSFSQKFTASHETAEIFSRSLRSIFFWSIPITLGGLVLADRLIPFVFGTEYITAIGAFKILIWNVVIYFLSSSMINLLYAGRQQRKAMVIFFSGAAANMVLNIFMIPMYGIEGAALTTLIAEIVVLVGIYFLAKKITPIRIFHNLFTALTAGLIMTASLFIIRLDSLILMIAAGGGVYLLSYFLLIKVFKMGQIPFKEERGKIKELPISEDWT
jgi:O-antigen/teichoic acid export membrane protein